jgi:hypothetical protein
MNRKILSMELLIIVFTMTCQAQRLYSYKNLEQTSEENLSLYLTKAQKLKKTGGIITIAGPSTVVAGLLLMTAGESIAGYLGFFMLPIGVGVTTIGIPILATGSSRVKKISKVWNSKHNTAWIEFAPCGLYNYQTQNIQPGISLKIRF